MRSIEKLSKEEQDVKLLINSIKTMLTDIPYNFMYEDTDEDETIISENNKENNVIENIMEEI